ncbi:MAG: cobalamin biosynthesis protein CbiM [Desulfovibrionaceae bacterium CG1_02_65_16]|nr:MAG: cobalamin biosynthesis protein CbiM [Desulfovibrionaceae bacterium CG1_02_65_16]
MHISEGVLSTPILAAGAVLTAAGTAVGLRKLDYDHLMTVAILSAAFFVASLIHVPIGPTSVHLIFNGLLGAVLGWASFPAILVGLLLQAILFQFGGFTVLGVNTFDMAAPAVICALLFRPLMLRGGRSRVIGAFLCGSVSVLLATIFTSAALAFTDEGFIHAAEVLAVAHLPIMVAEGFFTVLIVGYLTKVRPDVFTSTYSNQFRRSGDCAMEER